MLARHARGQLGSAVQALRRRSGLLAIAVDQPPTPDVDVLTAALPAFTVLLWLLQLPDATVVRVWAAADGGFGIDKAEPVRNPLADVWRRSLERGRLIDVPAALDGWSQALLPEAVAARLGQGQASLVVVPSGWLWRMPFAALLLTDGRRVIQAATVQLAASATLFTTAAAASVLSLTGSVGWLDPGRSVTQERAALEAHLAPFNQPADAAALVGLLTDAKDRLQSGAEPVGLPAMAMVAGAVHVIGGTVEIDDEASDSILAEVYRLLRRGTPAPQALREAQLAYLDANPAAPLRCWAGLATTGRTTKAGAGRG